MKRIGFILLAIAAVLVGLLVGTLNSSPVQLDLLWIQFESPLGLAILLGFSLGIVVGFRVPGSRKRFDMLRALKAEAKG